LIVLLSFRTRVPTFGSTNHLKTGTTTMKTMTCRQLGGACDLQMRGDTADEIIKAQDRHLKEIVVDGDTAHEAALREMKGRWRHPLSGMKWYKNVKQDFAHQPEG
jgi:predicted small metal-binding protein